MPAKTMSSPEESFRSQLILREWEVWHTYSMFFSDPVGDLHGAARALVAAGACLCSVHKDGTAHWLNGNEEVVNTKIEYKTEPPHQRGKFSFELPSEIPSGSFIPEAIAWAARLRFEELRTSGEHPWMPDYIRLFLGSCEFLRGSGQTTCYPMVKLFESGVILVELRFIGPKHPIYVEDFIRTYVNLHEQRFERMRIPPRVARLMARVETQNIRDKWPFRKRLRLARAHKLLDRAFSEKTIIHEESDFSFELTEVSRGKGENAHDTLSTFSLSIVRVIGYVLGVPRPDVWSILLGYRPALRAGSYWNGRPHIHVVRHARQAETAQENEQWHQADLGWILARTWYRPDRKLGVKYLPPNHRDFGDVGVYLTTASTLWVWARRGLREQAQFADPNRAHLIYHHQCIVELLEYGHMLHRQILYRANGHATSDQVLAARRELVALRQFMKDFSHFGEIRDLLRRGWDELGVPELRESITDALEIRETETSLTESRLDDRRNRIITFAFGLIAVPSIAGDVVQPFWKYLGWWRPATDEAYTLLTVGVAVAIVTALIRAWDAWLGRRQDP